MRLSQKPVPLPPSVGETRQMKTVTLL